MKFIEFLEKLKLKNGQEPKRSSNGYIACCPAHDDETPSLSIGEENGKILVNCFAGCTVEAICDSLDLQVVDLFEKPQRDIQKIKRTIYSYTDEHGRELYRKVRVEPGKNGKGKDFFCERDEKGKVVKNLKGCRKVLYRLPEVLKAISEKKTIFLVEGEKDSDKLFSKAITATTAIESLKWYKQYTETLKDADVVILYDMDKTGLERRDLLCRELYGKVKRLRVVDLPGLQYQESHGKDISDWLANGDTVSKLQEILLNTPDYKPEGKNFGIRVVTIAEFLAMEIPKREMILSPFLPSQGLCLLYAKRGVGKTHVAMWQSELLMQ